MSNVICHGHPSFSSFMKPSGRFTEDYQNAKQGLFLVKQTSPKREVGSMKEDKIVYFISSEAHSPTWLPLLNKAIPTAGLATHRGMLGSTLCCIRNYTGTDTEGELLFCISGL